MDELGGLQYWIQQKGGDPTVHQDWHDLRVLGTDVTVATRIVVDDKALASVAEKLAARLNSTRPSAETNGQ
jgi:hypothetical protein